jgi:hypothetical protein
VAVNRRVALPPPARRAGLPVVPAGWVTQHARIDHPPVTLPSPVLVVKLTVCGCSAPENVAAVRVPPAPSVLLVVSSLLGWVAPDSPGPNLDDVYTAKTDRRLTSSNARVVIPLLSSATRFCSRGGAVLGWVVLTVPARGGLPMAPRSSERRLMSLE